MALEASDLQAFASAGMPTTDAAASGGAIDLLRRVIFVEQATGTIEIVSTDGADTQNCTVIGRLASGASATETLALTGATPKVFANSYERLLSVELAANATGTITVRLSGGGATFATIAIGERGFMRLFRNAASESGQVARYEKLFIKNIDGALDLLTANVTLDADPESKMTFTLSAAKDDNGAVANRKTVPDVAITDPDVYDANLKGVPTGTLAHGEAIGVWVKMTLGAVDTPLESYFTLGANGASS